MDFCLRLRAERAPDFFITAEGRDAQICSRMENHLIVTTYCEVLESENRKIAPLRIHIENEIPIGKGCGSSAAARLAGYRVAPRLSRRAATLTLKTSPQSSSDGR